MDSRENFQKPSAFAQEYMPQVAHLITHYTGETPSTFCRVEDEIEKFRRGGWSSSPRLPHHRPDRGDDHHRRQYRGYVGVRNFDDTVFKTNLEAAQTIARQHGCVTGASSSSISSGLRIPPNTGRPKLTNSTARPGPRPYPADGQWLHRPGPVEMTRKRAGILPMSSFA